MYSGHSRVQVICSVHSATAICEICTSKLGLITAKYEEGGRVTG